MWTLVTGGAIRLGGAICKELASKGHSIVVHHHKSDPAEILKECRSHGVQAESIQGDFNDLEPFITSYLKRFGKLDHLINNIGNYNKDPLMHIETEEWLSLYQTNLHAPFSLIRALQPKKSITNIGVAGLDTWRTDPYSSAFRMTKMGLWMLTRSLAHELKQVQVNMVSPGQLEGSVNQPSAQALPMKRLGTYEEVAKTVAFIMENPYITGQNIEVSGGYKLFS